MKEGQVFTQLVRLAAGTVWVSRVCSQAISASSCSHLAGALPLQFQFGLFLFLRTLMRMNFALQILWVV